MSKIASDTQTLPTVRRRIIGPSLKLAYRRPLHVVRASMQYVFDADGRRYIDAYNNVPHVGHSHRKVLGAVVDQLALINTNTRYLRTGQDDVDRVVCEIRPGG